MFYQSLREIWDRLPMLLRLLLLVKFYSPFQSEFHSLCPSMDKFDKLNGLWCTVTDVLPVTFQADPPIFWDRAALLLLGYSLAASSVHAKTDLAGKSRCLVHQVLHSKGKPVLPMVSANKTRSGCSLLRHPAS